MLAVAQELKKLPAFLIPKVHNSSKSMPSVRPFLIPKVHNLRKSMPSVRPFLIPKVHSRAHKEPQVARILTTHTSSPRPQSLFKNQKSGSLLLFKDAVRFGIK
jgi:hypothetical protein